jgi:anti-sigma factor (TIGR02949 family)
MKPTCEEIGEKLAGFVDGEIAADAADEIAAHVSHCSNCGDREKTQRAVKAVLSNPAVRQSTPHDVRARIMRSIERLPENMTFGSLVKRLFEFQPLPAFASLIFLVALPLTIVLLWGGQKEHLQPSPEEPLALVMNGQMEGEVVCIDCELLNISKTPYVHDERHRLGLRCTDGHYWNILQTDKGSELSSVGHLMHRRILVRGHIFPTQHLVEVTDYSVI